MSASRKTLVIAVIKHVAMVIAAPIIGLLYIVLFPFIGLVLSLALLLWMGAKALVTSPVGSRAVPVKALSPAGSGSL